MSPKILETESRAREKGKALFEVVFGKTKNDPLDSIKGISQAYKEIFGEYPRNYGKFPGNDKIIVPPEPDQNIDDIKKILIEAREHYGKGNALVNGAPRKLQEL